MADKNSKLTKRMIGRIAFAAIYLIVAFFLLWLFYKKIFYANIDLNKIEILFGWIWCFICGLIGFSFLSLKLIVRDIKQNSDNINPWFSYSIYYPIMIGIITGIIFLVISTTVSNYQILFFVGGGVLSFIFSFFIDSIKDVFLKLIT